MKSNTKFALYTAYCIGLGAGVTYLVEEIRHKNELLEITNSVYDTAMGIYKELLTPAPRRSYRSCRDYDFYSDKEKKDETMA